MSFDEALTAATGIQWDATDFQKCRDEIPIRGCWLSADPERTYRVALAGMELMPRLEFNQQGQLTDIYIGRKFKSGVTSATCETMHGRLLDDLVGKYERAKREAEKGVVVRRSPAGNEFNRSKDADEIMIAGFDRFRVATDKSDIALLTTFTAGSEYSPSACDIGFFVEGPKSFQRRPSGAEMDSLNTEETSKGE